jgi:hypothetical protein
MYFMEHTQTKYQVRILSGRTATRFRPRESH